jgi:hypothetical protein
MSMVHWWNTKLKLREGTEYSFMAMMIQVAIFWIVTKYSNERIPTLQRTMLPSAASIFMVK